MQYSLSELCESARARIAVPPYPRLAILARAQHASAHSPRKRSFVAAVIAGLSIVAIAAAAEVATQSHVRFTPSGGFVVSSSAKMASRRIHSDAEIREAAQQLNFAAVLPAGLPKAARPAQLFTAGKDMLAVTYDLPGPGRAPHHRLWVFLMNPATMGAYHAPLDRYRLHPRGRTYATLMWRAGSEQVIAVSNGLTPADLMRMKVAMQQKTR